ncbi:hypothetical protein NDU88_003472 [Pleurodeles waltl]|uniref:Uncharacterized protein n=1 Tax=Pleurodeles waltl TaxID=8319 RepID=A0AAV7VDE4_PLEWA|nr:hypothetical protein NDU88_003472 [Pleurodeles waltl]
MAVTRSPTTERTDFELQAHTEALENHSRQNNVRIRGFPTQAEGSDLNKYVEALFRQILEAAEDTDIQLDCVYCMGSPRPGKSSPDDILTCVHDFQMKEKILYKGPESPPDPISGAIPRCNTRI